jgi:transcriptional regulator with XRE-family HTH domain
MHIYEPPEVFDFRPIGAAIKRARIERGLSREELAELCEISEGYVKAIENSGKNPGFQVFWRIVTMFNISVDEYFYPERERELDSKRLGIMGMLRDMGDDDIYVVESTARSIADVRGVKAKAGK